MWAPSLQSIDTYGRSEFRFIRCSLFAVRYLVGVGTDVIVLNGGSSSGKTSIARSLQAILPRPWLTLGVDNLLEAMPSSWVTEAGSAAEAEAGVAAQAGTAVSGESLITFAPEGNVTLGPAFEALELAWYRGLAAMARADARVIIDEVFLSGAASQSRLRTELHDLDVLWVGIRCDAAVAADREASRQDRVPGMATSQADRVHIGVHYDVVVDTTSRSSQECAATIGELVRS
jgi:chloramphenicol 3-O phosphotransferase